MSRVRAIRTLVGNLMLRASKVVLGHPKRWPKELDEIFASNDTKAGVSVTVEEALTLPTLWACVRNIAEDLGKLPLILYQRSPDGRQRAEDHHLWELLKHQPNPELSAQTFREALQAYALTWGAGHAEIERDRLGRPLRLWPIGSHRISLFRDKETKKLAYKVRLPDGSAGRLAYEDVFTVMGLSLNGLEGLSPIGYARETIGLGLAASYYGSKFFAQDARPSGVLSHPASLSDRAYRRLKEEHEKMHAGWQNAHRMLLLEEGLKWEAIGIPPQDAQFLETRKDNALDVCRYYRMPPHKVGIMDGAIKSNIEQQTIDYVADTLMPWAERWHAAVDLKLLTPAERGVYFAEFLFNALLKGDIKSRYEAYKIGREMGVLSANDVRRMENLNTLGPQGDIYLIPMNMIPADKAEAYAEAQISKGAAAQRAALPDSEAAAAAPDLRSLAASFDPVFRQAAARCLRREAADVCRSVRRVPGDLPEVLEAVRGFYAEHREFVLREYRPVVEAMAAAVADRAAARLGLQRDEEAFRDLVDACSARLAERRCGWAIRELECAAAAGEPAEAVEAAVSSWQESLPAQISRTERAVIASEVIRHVYLEAEMGGVR